jgi:hypothetical protein
MSNEKNDNALWLRAVARGYAFDVVREAITSLTKRLSTEMIAVINNANLPGQIKSVTLSGSGSKMMLTVFENENKSHEFEIGVQRYRAENACCLDVIIGSPMEMED